MDRQKLRSQDTLLHVTIIDRRAEGNEHQESADQEQSGGRVAQPEAGLAGCVQESGSWKDEQGRRPRETSAQAIMASSPAEEAGPIMEAREGW